MQVIAHRSQFLFKPIQMLADIYAAHFTSSFSSQTCLIPVVLSPASLCEQTVYGQAACMAPSGSPACRVVSPTALTGRSLSSAEPQKDAFRACRLGSYDKEEVKLIIN